MSEFLPPGLQAIVLRAAVKVNKHEDEQGGMARFRGLAFSGEVFDHGWYEKFGVDLATMSSKAKVRILRNHDFDQEVGEAELVNDGTKLTLENGRLFDHVEAAHTVDGILKQGGAYEFSIGMTGKMKRYDPPETRMLNGRMQEVSWLVYDGRVFETSFVPAGADENTFAEMLSVKLGGKPPVISNEDEGDDMSKEELAAANARIAQLEAEKIAAEKATAASLKAARLAVVKAKLAEVGVTDEKSIAGFGELSEESFEATLAVLAANKATDEKTRKLLTQHQGTGEDDADNSEEKGTTVEGLAGKFVRTGLSLLVDRSIAATKRAA
jgi:hypothetical protein